jgi:hypothetical protein
MDGIPRGTTHFESYKMLFMNERYAQLKLLAWKLKELPTFFHLLSLINDRKNPIHLGGQQNGVRVD